MFLLTGLYCIHSSNQGQVEKTVIELGTGVLEDVTVEKRRKI